MSMAAAMRNVGGGNMLIFQRRGRHERVSTNEDHDDDVEGSFVNVNSRSSTTRIVTETDIDIEAAVAEENPDTEGAGEDVTDGEEPIAGVNRHEIRHTVTLAELEEEREIARRRSSACVLFALFVLFRLWVLALQDGDFGLLMLCLVGTSWTARWIRYNREQEEELDRRIANYIENQDGDGNDVIARDDLRMLSFQAQLALAIMESQRQMMLGGYGHPDGEATQPGVSDESKAKWTLFKYQKDRDKKASQLGSYGSVEPDALKQIDEEPHCSICLGEYEEDEKLTKLPCSHIYHEECINSWCSNHTRCPLCNFDLEETPVPRGAHA